MTNQQKKEYIALVKQAQLADNPMKLIHRCPRCGRHMAENVLHNALSRHEDVYICDNCGTGEAVRDWKLRSLHIDEWFVFSCLEKGGEFPTTMDLHAIEPIVEDGCLEVTFECWFDQEAKFGVDLSDYDTWLNLYASYNPATANLVVSYVVSDNVNNFHYLYVPTEMERYTVIQAMTRCCNVHGYRSIAAMVAGAEASKEADSNA